MKKHKIDTFTKGWFLGDFTPSLLRTSQFESAVKFYNKGDKEAAHVHPVAHEYTVIGAGRFRMNDIVLEVGDIMELKPGEASDFECLESGVTFVVKSPSVPNDKILVKK